MSAAGFQRSAGSRGLATLGPGPAQNGHVPEDDRRRQAATLLQIAEATCRYAASVLSNGTGPAEAQGAALEAAAELVVVAEALRRLTFVGPGERRELALQLNAAGWSRDQIAERLGVSEQAVRKYLADRRGA